MLRNGRWIFRWAVIESLRLGVGDFSCGRFRTDKTFRVEDMVPNLGVFGMRGSPRKVRRGGGSGMDTKTYGCLGEALGNC